MNDLSPVPPWVPLLAGAPVDAVPASTNLMILGQGLHGMLEAGEFTRTSVATRVRVRGAIMSIHALSERSRDEANERATARRLPRWLVRLSEVLGFRVWRRG